MNSPFSQVRSFLLAAILSILPLTNTHAFNGERVTEGDLTIEIGTVVRVDAASAKDEAAESLSKTGTPVQVPVILSNAGAQPLSIHLRASSVAEDVIIHQPERTAELPAKGNTKITFAFSLTEKAEIGLYPFHIVANSTTKSPSVGAHAVQIFSTESLLPPRDSSRFQKQGAVAVVPEIGALDLTSLHNQQVSYQIFNQEKPVTLPIGWQGADRESGMSLSQHPVDRPDPRMSLNLHPPYRKGAGTMFVEYRLSLPKTSSLRFSFDQAIRDSKPDEGTSDGVTFRVRVDGKVLFDRHSDSKTWLHGEVDLSPFAGREIVLSLECHPGPKNNTNCDSAYWGAPTVSAGNPPTEESAESRTERENLARQVLSGNPSSDKAIVFPLGPERQAVIVPGPRGIIDAVIALSAKGKTTLMDGFEIELDQQSLRQWPSSAQVVHVATHRDGNALRIDHDIVTPQGHVTLPVKLWADGPGLRIQIVDPADSQSRITRLAPGTFEHQAQRMYYGHGYCIVHPQKFTARGGGHDLAASHVGMDFTNGLSLLVASEMPPDAFEVDPDRHRYALVSHPASTYTLLPGADGAFDSAIAFRSIDPRTAAPAVAKKAGRFVFDLWGGDYRENADLLERCFHYGLTDSLVILHNWQRWGYDYRLPDIFPPNPKLGTIEDLRHLGELCRKHGVLWGLHDNYIDIYPDAEGFSYDLTSFHPDGRPRLAWLNEGRQAQSYQFRPDRLRPFLERNLSLIQDAFHPTTSFVDVWSSMNVFDFYDRDGQFHSRTETRKAWGDAFSTIRKTFGGNAPTISEAGSDQLVGQLDGADCQFLMIAQKGDRHVAERPCDDWERVPWFDAVLHSRFSLHGVGYSVRYQGPLSRDLHGIGSDDYISAEILTGHALMVDRGSLIHDAVRKYWLAQDIIASLRSDEIKSVTFDHDDIHRLIVRWKSGATIHVNRGKDDWKIDGRILPEYGFLARSGDAEASIERIRGQVVEQSRSLGKTYFNGRGFVPNTPLEIRPRAAGLEDLGNREFRLLVDWEAKQATETDMSVFYHFVSASGEAKEESTKDMFTGGGDPTPPSSQWQGKIQTGKNWKIRIPENFEPGEYSIRVGLFDRKGRGQRAHLRGSDDGNHRYEIARLVLEGNSQQPGQITAIRMIESQLPESPHLMPNLTTTDFGDAITSNGIRIITEAESIRVTPLPDEPMTALSLRPEKITGSKFVPERIEACDITGQVIRKIDFQMKDSLLSFSPIPEGFSYRIVKAKP